jgi:hypothetical protein
VSNPIDDYLGMHKKAFGFLGPNFGRQAMTSMREGAAQAVGQGAVGLAAAGIGVAAMKSYRALRKRSDFKQMLEANPDLAEHQEADPMKFNAHYNSLRAMNPGYAEDPIIAGTLMRQMSLSGNNAGHVLMESMDSSSRSRGQGPQFTLGSKITDKGQETSSGFRF